MNILEHITPIRMEPSTNIKRALYREACEEHPHIAEIFNATYNPSITYGVTLSSIPTQVRQVGLLHSMARPEGWDIVSVLLTQLSTRELSGGAAQLAIMDVLSHYCPADQQIIRCILDRDLHCGFTAGFSTNVFQVALANKFDEKKHKLDRSWFLSRKLDGVRCIAKVGKDSVEFLSRTGKPFTSLKNLEADILECFEPGTVLDGEVCLVNEQGLEDFIAVVSEIKRKDHTIAQPKYYLFDCMSTEDFNRGQTDSLLSERLEGLQELVGGVYGTLSVLEQVRYTQQELDNMRSSVAQYGWEGLMARKDVPYRAGRSNDLLKIKEFHDDEYTVVGVQVGSMDVMGLTYDNMLLSAKIMHKGCEVSVGSGFSLDQRKGWGADPEKLIGKVITVKYFEESKNRNGGVSLRFPTFKCLHGEKRTV